jgi:hypothetical protein
MSLNYNEPNEDAVVQSSLEANPSISASTLSAISVLLGNPEPTTPIVVGSWDGTGAVTKPAGEDTQLVVVDIDQPEGETVDITIPAELANNPVWVFDTDANINVRFNTVERVIQSGNGSDNIEVAGDSDTTLDGAGGNDSIKSSGGDDSIEGGDGQDTIDAGAGNDTILGGLGSDVITGVLGNDTIDGGAGYDMVMLSATETWTAQAVGSDVVFSNAGDTITADVSNIELVQYAETASTLTQFSYAITADATEADALRLYQTALGRSADSQGAQFWLDAVESGATVQQLGADFVASTEFSNIWSDVENNEQLVNQIFENAFGREADDEALVFWTEALDNGLSVGDFVATIASTDEAADSISNVIVVSSIV